MSFPGFPWPYEPWLRNVLFKWTTFNIHADVQWECDPSLNMFSFFNILGLRVPLDGMKNTNSESCASLFWQHTAAPRLDGMTRLGAVKVVADSLKSTLEMHCTGSHTLCQYNTQHTHRESSGAWKEKQWWHPHSTSCKWEYNSVQM